MTERLYYTDAYLTTFEARVTDRADDGRRIYLDRTAFYPTSGGQQFDTGMLGNARVIDVIDEDDRIAHVLESPVEGEHVEARVDWTRRYDHMQQHTGQHVLSAVFEELFGFATVSVHFGTDSSSLDLDTSSLDREQVVAAESRANALVFENRPVTVTFEDAAAAMGLRKAPAREGTLRIVSIADLDRSACGGTHVRATGEIGAILLRKAERVKKAARVEFVCGARAVRRARADFDALTRIAQSLSASLDEAPTLALAQAEQLRAAETARKKLEGELHAYRARERYDATQPDASGARRAVERRATGSLEEMKGRAFAFCALPKSVFIGIVEQPPSLLVVASEDSAVDAGRALKSALAEVGGRGGGSPRVAQGSVPSAEALARVIELLSH